MTLKIVSIPVNGRWHYAAPDLGPLPRLNPVRFATEFIFGAGTDQLDQRISLAVSLSFNHAKPNVRAAQVTLACAPHVIRQYLLDPTMLTMPQQNEVDLDVWIGKQKNIGRDPSKLPEALEGGKANYMWLCREDVLRILWQHYRAEGAGHGMPHQEIGWSALKRRYYEEQVILETVRTLLRENLLAGEVQSPSIQPLKRRDVQDEVETAERRALENAVSQHIGSQETPNSRGEFEPTSCLISLQVVDQGQVHDGWEALRAILAVATMRVDIEDAHINADVVALLRSVPDGVAVRVLTRKLYEDADPAFRRLAQQRSGKLEVRTTADIHPRRLYVDERAYILEDSIKDLALKTASSIVPVKPNEALTLLEDFERRWVTAGVRIRPKA